MSIRAIAVELYRAQRNVAELQKAVDAATPVELEALSQELRAAQKEMVMLRRMLDGEKESGQFRKAFSGLDSWKGKI